MTVNTEVLVKEKIQKALILDPRVDARKISIDIVKGTVILRGEVPSFTSIQVAETIVKKAVGTEVQNHLWSTVTPKFAYR